MTEENRDPSPEEFLETRRVLKHRMLNIAFKDRSLDAWTLRKVQQLDLFEGEFDPVEGNLDLEILRNPDHPRRRTLPPGPLVLYQTEDPEPRNIIVELSELILSDSRDIREATLDNLGPMLKDQSIGITPRTSSELEANREALISDETASWRPAALAISRALSEDVFIAVQGVLQCLSCEPIINAGLKIFVPRVFHPSYSSFESIKPLDSPEALAARLEGMRLQVVGSSVSLHEACSEFYQEAGHFPLAPEVSYPWLVVGWLEKDPETDVWQEIWNWVSSDGGFLAGYHACTVFSMHPELIPSADIAVLWDKILSILYGSSKQGEGSPEHMRWKLIHDLTKHFIYHVEASIPQGDGFKICSLAWLLAERVASILDVAPGGPDFYLKNWIRPALQLSSHIWHIACSPITPTPLRSLVYSTLTPWAYSLACLIGAQIEGLLTEDVSEDVREKLHSALMSQIIPSLPLALEPAESPVYASNLTMIPLVERCTELLNEEQSSTLNEMLRFSRELADPVKLCEEIRDLEGNTAITQFLLVIALRNQAFRGVEIAEQLWSIIVDEDWWSGVLENIEPHILDLLMEGINAVQIRAGEEWFWRLPHIIATLCEKEDDEEQRKNLFLYLIQFSLASDTVSAIQRLLRGESKEKFASIVEEYRSRSEAQEVSYPPWIAGRMRAIRSCLREF